MRFKRTLILICLLLVGNAASLNAATKHALLVGVSEYPNLTPRFSLKGPKNDVQLVNEFLLTQHFEQKNITLLADGVDNADLPTYNNITTALDNLVAKSNKGDFVYLHFSGHGSQQPAKPDSNEGSAPNETDGLDEIFLPRDIEKWNDTIGEVKNAIIDDQIGDVIDRIRKKGAFVWVIFDSCHSGTMTRSVSVGYEKERRLDPNDLGIPPKALVDAEKMSIQSRSVNDAESVFDNLGEGDSMGGYVAFYAAQTIQTTPEMNLPKNNPDRQPHGLFTYSIIEALSARPGVTYRQVAQKILQKYTILNRHNPTPLFEGSLDNLIWNNDAQSTNVIRQWKVSQLPSGKIQLKAGTLNQLNDGSILGIYSDPTADDKDVLGYIELTKVKLTSSHGKSVAYKDKPVLKRIPAAAYARLHAANLSYQLYVAAPDEATDLKIASLLTQVQKDRPELNIVLVKPEEQADVRLYVDQAADKLWFLPPSGQTPEENSQIQTYININNGDVSKFELANALNRIAKLSNLLRLGDNLGDQNNPQLKATFYIDKDDEWVEVQSFESPTLSDQQAIKMVLSNDSKESVDVTLLFIDSLYGITPVFPNQYQPINRIEPSKSITIEGSIDTSSSTGNEGFMMIAVAAQPNAEIADFSYLAQQGFTKTKSITSSGGNLGELLMQAGFGENLTRGFGLAPVSSGSSAKMQMFRWTTAQ